jgi:hypothetical protein
MSTVLPEIVAVGILVTTIATLIAINRRFVTAVRARRQDPQNSERVRGWTSLSADQRHAATLEARRGEAVTDPETAAVMLRAGTFDPVRAPFPWALPAATVVGIAFGVGAISLGLGYDIIFPILIGVGSVVAGVMSAILMWRQRTRRVLLKRSRRATEARHTE